MIVSRARHPYIFNAFAGTITLIVMFLPYYNETDQKNNVEFVPEKFMQAVFFSVLFCTFLMLAVMMRKRKIIVHPDLNIEIQLCFGFKKIFFHCSEIRSMKWGNESSLKGGNGSSVSYANKFAEIAFKDGSILQIDEYNYKNAHELRQWFFNYCANMGIIDVKTAAERKRDRILRRLARFKKQ